VLIQNGSELKKIVPGVKQKFYLFPEFQNGESLTQLAEADGLDYRPNINKGNWFMEFARNCRWC